MTGLANKILTPVTLWKDFDGTLPLCEDILSESQTEEYRYRELYFLGRKTQYGRVKIYAKYFTPNGLAEYPAVLLLFEAGMPADLRLVPHFIEHGYAVLAVDYCGDMGDGSKHTIYPRDIDYANYARRGRAMDYADESAKETSWYEWAAVARYAARYLDELPETTRVGMIGLRTGGEVLWKIAPYAPVSCFISVCAAGWLAYRDMEKFTGENCIFDEERHRFIAGLDSQSYAPHVKCPVLLLSAINDKKSNYDRIYDTFQQINPEVDKAILYSSHGNGLIGSHSFDNIDLFLDKYLKGRSVYLCEPVHSKAFTDEEGNLKVRIEYDPMGDPEECGVFYTENVNAFKARDWTRIVRKVKDLNGETPLFPLDVYVNSSKALYYSFVRYSNNFSSTSKIQEITLHNPYKNACLRSRILYTAERDGLAGFSVFRRRAGSIADCFADTSSAKVELKEGYGGILGVCCSPDVISYRVSEPKYEPPQGASLAFDAYSPECTTLCVTFYKDAEEEKGYTVQVPLEGGGKWKKIVLDSRDFKTETGSSLSGFEGVMSVVFSAPDDALITNLIWL